MSTKEKLTANRAVLKSVSVQTSLKFLQYKHSEAFD